MKKQSFILILLVIAMLTTFASFASEENPLERNLPEATKVYDETKTYGVSFIYEKGEKSVGLLASREKTDPLYLANIIDKAEKKLHQRKEIEASLVSVLDQDTLKLLESQGYLIDKIKVSLVLIEDASRSSGSEELKGQDTRSFTNEGNFSIYNIQGHSIYTIGARWDYYIPYSQITIISKWGSFYSGNNLGYPWFAGGQNSAYFDCHLTAYSGGLEQYVVSHFKVDGNGGLYKTGGN